MESIHSPGTGKPCGGGTAGHPDAAFRGEGNDFFAPGLFDGEHIFTIEPLGTGRVRFTQRETFTGLLVPLLARMLDTGTQHGFEEMNKALKARAEQPQSDRNDDTGQ
jgi:hypothetical protein